MFSRLRDGFRVSLGGNDPNHGTNSSGSNHHDSGNSNDDAAMMMPQNPNDMHNLRNPQNLHAGSPVVRPRPTLAGRNRSDSADGGGSVGSVRSVGSGRGGLLGKGGGGAAGGGSLRSMTVSPSGNERGNAATSSLTRPSFFPPFMGGGGGGNSAGDANDLPVRGGSTGSVGSIGGGAAKRGGGGGPPMPPPPSSFSQFHQQQQQPPPSKQQQQQQVPPSPHRKSSYTQYSRKPSYGDRNNNPNTSNRPQDRSHSKSPTPYAILNPSRSANPSPRATPGKSPFSAERLLSAATFRGLSAPPFSKPPFGKPSSGPDNSNGAGTGQHTDPEFLESQNQRETLEAQIRHRDTHISKLQHELHHLQDTYRQMQKDHLLLRRQHLESSHRHVVAIQLWKRTNEGLKARVECFATETTAAAAKEIASLIRDAAPENKDSTYLMTLQDQLSKATVKLDHLANQTEIVLHKGEEVIESLREEMNEVIRERSRMEIELMDQRSVLENEKERMRRAVERRIWRVEKELEFLEKKAVEELGGDDGSQSSGGVGSRVSRVEDGTGDKIEEEEEGNEEEKIEEKNEEKNEQDANGDKDPLSKSSNSKEESEPAPTPEELRQKLRQLTLDKDRKMYDLRNNLRKKNEEFHHLLRIKESRERHIRELEREKYERDREKREREEWARGRDEFHGMGIGDIGIGMDDYHHRQYDERREGGDIVTPTGSAEDGE